MTTTKFTDKQRRAYYDLLDLLDKLGIKTRPILWVESLEATLKMVTFDDEHLQDWSKLPKS